MHPSETNRAPGSRQDSSDLRRARLAADAIERRGRRPPPTIWLILGLGYFAAAALVVIAAVIMATSAVYILKTNLMIFSWLSLKVEQRF